LKVPDKDIKTVNMEAKPEGETVYRNSTDESHIVMNERFKLLLGASMKNLKK